jgi:hypothetical protein
MVDGIVSVFVVLAIFAVVASLLTLYVWRADPQQFTMWRAVLRSRREGREASTPQSAGLASRKLRARSFGNLRRGVVSEPVPPVATMPPVTTSGKSAAAQLEYWVEIGRYPRRTP